ncbi:hypothetical protein R6Q59_010045 [Mikania micrantha]
MTTVASHSTGSIVSRILYQLRSFQNHLQPIQSTNLTISKPFLNMDLTHYLADSPPTIVKLEIKPHFEALNKKEKQYAHHLSRAAHHGTRITLNQVSPESEPIYDLILALHKSCNGNYETLLEDTGADKNDVRHWLEYAAQFLGNNGNYKGFGDVKFIPRVPKEKLERLCTANEETKSIFETAMKSGGGIYETKTSELMQFGYTDAGHMTNYYPESPDITKDDIQIVSNVLEDKQLLVENTRLRKLSSGDFELLIASGVKNPPASERDLGDVDEVPLTGHLEGKKLRLAFGDYQNHMSAAAVEIKKAEKVAANDVQGKMLEEYAKSFGTGSMNACVNSQRWWIKDKKPMVETNIGFVETYRDPHGVRGEWEGFVAMVNLERTRAFGKLVDSAEAMIPKLPWTKDFEKDKFLSPDFTSLEVLTFAGSGIPAGINIPNFDVVRQNEGFKNVSLGNVLSAKPPKQPIPFIRAEDDEIYRKYRDSAFEVQVGIHELLGHGTGKLLQETSPDVYNFDVHNLPISPIDNKPISTWYKPGQTWGSVFGSIASSYEECRAECVAMALSCDFSILQIFGFGDGTEDMSSTAGDVLYTSYLSMARAGIAAVEYWDPKSRKWGQAHMQARFSILRTFLDAGDSFVQLKSTKDDFSDLEIHLDRAKIPTVGRKAVESYLQKLHVYKSTADFENGRKLYEGITSVESEYWGKKVRDAVLKKKQPRMVFVQANTVVDEQTGDVKLVEYEPTAEDMVRSFVERNV